MLIKMETTQDNVDEKSKWKVDRKHVFNIIAISSIILGCFISCTYMCGNVNYGTQYQSLKYSATNLVNSVLKLKLPKPSLLLQAFQDLLPFPLRDASVYASSEYESNGKQKSVEMGINKNPRQPAANKQPQGASILYVNSFCSQLFGGKSNLELCRTEVKLKCDIDVLSWFKIGPAESIEMLESVQDCVTNSFNMETDFIEKLNYQVLKKENQSGQHGSFNKRGSRSLLVVVIVLSVVVLLVVGGVKYYRWKEKKKKEKELDLKMQEVDGQAVKLKPDNYKDEPDIFEECTELDISWEVCDDTADTVRDSDPYLNIWIAFFEEILTKDEFIVDFQNVDFPESQDLNISIQEDLFDNARVGSTAVNECEFEFEINEDSVVVTGFTVNKDNPLEFTFWRKMLRDVREQLKADALAKLKLTCPTLFAMGWFKENLPKSEEEFVIEEEEFDRENA